MIPGETQGNPRSIAHAVFVTRTRRTEEEELGILVVGLISHVSSMESSIYPEKSQIGTLFRYRIYAGLIEHGCQADPQTCCKLFSFPPKALTCLFSLRRARIEIGPRASTAQVVA